jgi:hypothetical protein
VDTPSCTGLGEGNIGIQRAVSKGHRLQATHPQGVEESGMAGQGETLMSPWPPLAIRPWMGRRGKWGSGRRTKGHLQRQAVFSGWIHGHPILIWRILSY